MNPTPIHLSRPDYTKLRLLLAATTSRNGLARPHALAQELDRAVVMDDLPSDVVALDSCVEFEDINSGEVAEYVITLPERANVDAGRISVLAPIGTALIGYRAGDTVSWATPGGVRLLRLRRVSPDASLVPAGLHASGTVAN